MKMGRIIRGKTAKLLIVLWIVLLALGGLSACAKEDAEDPGTTDDVVEEETGVSGEIMIAAAASLEAAFTQELIPMFKEQNPDAVITGVYDASGKLQTQIEEGLEAAIFMSAATKQMTALKDGGFIDAASVTDLLENELVLITGSNTQTTVTGFANIADAATIAIGDPASVPAGQYAQESLTSLGSWDAVSAKSSLGTNVTEVLNWVAEGSAEVGVVYATDAAQMPDKVKVLEVAPADSLKAPVIYPVGILAGLSDEQQAVADAFLAFLKSDDALAVFEKYGFKAL